MGYFQYKAVSETGEHIAGSIEAADRKSAVSALMEKGQYVLELIQKGQSAASTLPRGEYEKQQPVTNLRILPASSGQSRRAVSSKDVLAFTSQLSAALRAGLSLIDAIIIIRNQQHKAAVRQMLDQVADSVRAGKSLSEALAAYPKAFSPMYVSMVRVGETGGMLEKTTTYLANIMSRDEKVKTSLKNASAYPIFVLCIGLVSVVIVLTWILPKILDTISGGVAVLPWPTRMLLALSNFLTASVTTVRGWFFIIVVIMALIYLARWLKGPGKVRFDAFKLKIPIVGSVLLSIAVGRFTRTLGALTGAGVTILESLAVVRDTLGNEFLALQIDKVVEKVKAGSSVAEPLAQSGYFPPLLVQITSVGEQTGKLDELLLNAAETFDEQADAAINRFVALFPAVLITLLALVVGFIIAATLLPIVVMELSAGKV